jgi:hypothetical protein
MLARRILAVAESALMIKLIAMTAMLARQILATSGGICSSDQVDCDDGVDSTVDSCSGGVYSNDPVDCGAKCADLLTSALKWGNALLGLDLRANIDGTLEWLG